MSGTVGVLAFVVTLILMVMIHESGHYSTARMFGMKVEEFFFGFGPRLLSWRRGETEYGVKAIPAGGYVKIAGMNELAMVQDAQAAEVGAPSPPAKPDATPAATPVDESRYFRSKPAWQRAIVLAAGSATHFIFAAVLLTFSFAVLGIIGNPTTTLDSVTASPTARSGIVGPAAQAGLLPGDRIVAANGTKVTSWDQIQAVIRDHAAAPVTVEVNRSGRLQTFTVTPASRPNPTPSATPTSIGFIGVSPRVQEIRQALPVAAWSAVKEVGALIVGSVKSIGVLFSPSGFHRIFASLGQSGQASPTSPSTQPVGLVGGARLAGQAVETGQGQPLIDLLAAFIVFLGVLNLMPLPPLDGGHLLVLGIEKVRGRPVDARKVVPVAAFVLGTMIILSVAILYLDIIHPVANPFQ